MSNYVDRYKNLQNLLFRKFQEYLRNIKFFQAILIEVIFGNVEQTFKILQNVHIIKFVMSTWAGKNSQIITFRKFIYLENFTEQEA